MLNSILKEILNCFYTVITKTRKFAKADMKAALDELEQKIEANQKVNDQGLFHFNILLIM